MIYRNYFKRDCNYFVIVVFVFILLLIISPDSYLHYLFGRDDSAMYFTAGKAMMKGMIPYVDFTDSKGPFLWLIYGIGYIISHYNYIGIFWLSVISFSITFIYLYKLSYLYLNDEKTSLLSTIATSFFIFCVWWHWEVKSEDWCQPFIVICLYYSCKMYQLKNIQNDDLKKTFFSFGIAFSVCLLIKYNIAAMLCSVFIYDLYYIIKNKHNVFLCISCFFIGFSIIIIPFLVYFDSIDVFHAFIKEYFVNTITTIRLSEKAPYIHEILYSISVPQRLLLFLISLIGSIIVSKYQRNGRSFLIFVVIIFWAISIHHAAGHYFNAATPLSVFFCISVFSFYRESINKRFKRVFLGFSAFIFILLISTNCFTYGYLNKDLIFVSSQQLSDIKNIYKITSRFNSPKMIFYNSLDRGEGIKADAVPGSVYWFSQLGATPEMIAKQVKDIKLMKADFIITESLNKEQLNRQVSFLCILGYKVVYINRAKDRWGLLRVLLINPKRISGTQ